ncbi:MAG: NYN domain-containing protein [Scytolyngbya sp. HA4215-MV1]|nr:NYN domain-containing protein [Scytolyngbya sp. HA4215-MV1]
MPRSTYQALFLVDGYNIIGTWMDLKKVRDCVGLEEARRRLIELMADYSAFQGFDTRIVFDAQYQGSRGSREVFTHNLSAQYTHFGQTADTYIEKACADFRHDLRKFQQRLIVATSDRAQQLTVIGYGAEWMSAEQLAGEVQAIVHRVQRQQKAPKRSSSRMLANSLDPAARQHLTKLRLGIHEGFSK